MTCNGVFMAVSWPCTPVVITGPVWGESFVFFGEFLSQRATDAEIKILMLAWTSCLANSWFKHQTGDLKQPEVHVASLWMPSCPWLPVYLRRPSHPHYSLHNCQTKPPAQVKKKLSTEATSPIQEAKSDMFQWLHFTWLEANKDPVTFYTSSLRVSESTWHHTTVLVQTETELTAHNAISYVSFCTNLFINIQS